MTSPLVAVVVRFVREDWVLLTCAALYLALGLWLRMTSPTVTWDDPWTLQVISRLHAGETLYRDVFCGVTPLGIYLALGMTQLLGVELWVTTLSMVLISLGAYLFSIRIIRRITGVRTYDVFFAVAMLLYGLPERAAVYQPLANLFLLVCFDAILRCEANRPRENSRDWGIRATSVLIGVSAGLCFASKQNVGIYTMAAGLAALSIQHRAHRHSTSAPEAPASGLAKYSLITCWLLALIGFVLVVTAAMLPVMLSGGWEKLLDYGFVNKTTYLRAAGISYVDGVRDLLLALAEPPTPVWARKFRELQIFLLPAIALVGLLVTLGVGEKSTRSRGAIVLCLVCAAALSVYPRADLGHIVYGAPGFLIGVVYSWHVLRMRSALKWRRLTQLSFWLLVLAGISLQLHVSYRHVTANEYVWSDLPHFRYKVFRASDQTYIRSQAQWLTHHTAGEPTLLLAPDASLYYLVAGLKNPTPFDYPLLTAFGTSGMKEVMTALVERRIRAVCMKKIDWPLAPVELERYVESTLRLEEHAGLCDLYRVQESGAAP